MEKGTLINQGRTAEVFEYGDGYVLKLYRNGMPKEAVIDEFNVSKFVYENGLSTPCPKEIVNLEERKGIVFERVDGVTMMNSFMSKPWRIAKEAQKLAELHFEMHKVKVSGIPSQKQKFIQIINATDRLSDDKKKAIIEYTKSLNEESYLCHGDFHPDNIIISDDKYLIIDWMTGTMGNPLCDVARTYLLLKGGALPPGTSLLKKRIIEFGRRKFCSEYIKHYLRISGKAMEDVERWFLPVAAARLMEWLPEYEKAELLKLVDEKYNNIIIK